MRGKKSGKKIRKVGTALSVALATTAVTVGTATPAIADKVLVVGGINTPSLHPVIMGQLLGKRFQNDELYSVGWPAQARPFTGASDLTLGESIEIGKQNLTAALATALASGDRVTVVGLSAGSLVVDEVLRGLSGGADDPDPAQLSIVIVADSSRQKAVDDAKFDASDNYTYQPPPATAYHTITITGEYDGMADFPDRWWNFLAVANAFAGALFVHVPAMFAPLDTVPTKNITTTYNELGTPTTHYLIPTAKLPLVQLMPWLKWKEASLKASVDRGYARNDAPPPAAAAAKAAVPTTTAKVAPAPVATASKTTAASTSAAKADTVATTAESTPASTTAKTVTTSKASTVGDTDDDAAGTTAVKASDSATKADAVTEEKTPTTGTKIRSETTESSDEAGDSGDAGDKTSDTATSGSTKSSGGGSSAASTDTASSSSATTGSEDTAGADSSTSKSSASDDAA